MVTHKFHVGNSPQKNLHFVIDRETNKLIDELILKCLNLLLYFHICVTYKLELSSRKLVRLTLYLVIE